MEHIALEFRIVIFWAFLVAITYGITYLNFKLFETTLNWKAYYLWSLSGKTNAFIMIIGWIILTSYILAGMAKWWFGI